MGTSWRASVTAVAEGAGRTDSEEAQDDIHEGQDSTHSQMTEIAQERPDGIIREDRE